MNEQEAIQVAEQNREMLQIDPEMAFESAEKAILEYKENPEESGPTTDRIAWLITFSNPWGFVVVNVDDRTGKVLSVEKSR
jgi:pantothenate kinase type III